MARKKPIDKSSGNVFRDLGLPDDEERLAKAQIAARICELIKQRKLTQTKAADLLGIDQPKVSALMQGKLGGFSSERLFRFLTALDQDVEIRIRPSRRTGARRGGRITVLTS